MVDGGLWVTALALSELGCCYERADCAAQNRLGTRVGESVRRSGAWSGAHHRGGRGGRALLEGLVSESKRSLSERRFRAGARLVLSGCSLSAIPRRAARVIGRRT